MDVYLSRVKAFRATTQAEFVAEPSIHGLAERYLQLALECSIDLANHFIADGALKTPDSNKATFQILGSEGVIPADLAARLAKAAGLRNILVHEYLEIDHASVWQTIQEDLGDLDAFAAWAASQIARP